MSILARSLRRQADGGFPHGNPLVNIGVSADVLDLGLTEDELHAAIVRGFAKQLVASIHPDRVGADKRPYLEILQRKYTQVYEELQDKATFHKALEEFRNMKSEERSEMRLLRNALEEAREHLNSLRAKEVELKTEWGIFTQDRLRFDAVDAQRKLVIPGLEADMHRLEAQNTRVTNSAIARRRQYRDLLRYVSFLGSEATSHAKGFFAFEARWVIVAMVVPSAWVHLVPSPTRKFKWKPEFLKAVELLNISDKELKAIRVRWNKSFRTLTTPLEKELDRGSEVRLVAFQLVDGVMKVVWGWDGERFRGNRVIGAMSSATMSVSRRELLHTSTLDEMFHHLSPILNVGDLLVSTKVKRTVTEGKTNRIQPFSRREIKMIILGVG